MATTCDAFITHFNPPLRLGTVAKQAPLHGLTLGVKDNYDVAGAVTGAGNPEYAADHAPATSNAYVVDALLRAGTLITGKTQMDELAYSLMGVNARYGVPLNPIAPQRVPGGSSSGSASATAAELVDIGLGTDTGGSVRLPAAFCGLYGWRTSHGLIPADGMVPLAPSYDVAGFFTRTLPMMRRVMDVFTAPITSPAALKFWLPADMWTVSTFTPSDYFGPKGLGLSYIQDPILPEGGSEACLNAFRLHQGYEIWQQLGAWVTQRQPDFGPGVRERFSAASQITADQFQQVAAYRQALRAHLAERMAPGTILLYPTAPGPAPQLTMPQDEMETYRNRALSLTSLAGHAGLPQLTIPFCTRDDAPLGLSLVTLALHDSLLAEGADLLLSLTQKG